MDLFSGKIDLTSLGYDHVPLVRVEEVQVAPPNLRDNTGFADRLVRAVRKHWGLDDAVLPWSRIPTIGAMLNEHGWRVRVAWRVDNTRPATLSITPPGPGPAYGLAVDMGSTTLVLALVDMDAPAVLGQTTVANPQAELGADILTRVHLADRPEGLALLVDRLRTAINRGAARLCSEHAIETRDLQAGVLSGNTTMTHFLLGLPVRTLIREPYVPVLNNPEGMRAGQIGLNLAADAPLLIMPNKGSYFGGDLMAGLVASGMSRSEELCMLVDVGTNAEVVMGQKDWLIGAAGAAGPALEGGVAAMGMTAGPGAVDRVRIDRNTKELSWRTIDDRPPRGICGSGLIDLFAEMFLSELINFQGKLTLPAGHPRRMETDEGPAFIVVEGKDTASGEPILLTEVEIDILTRSKAAMYTIINTVAMSVGLSIKDIRRFYVAGTFGQYIDPRMAVAVGMVPDIPLERFVPLGNSSLKGAVLALLSAKARAEIMRVWQQLTYLEMNVNQDLMNRFSAARFIPHTNRHYFPSVGTIIT